MEPGVLRLSVGRCVLQCQRRLRIVRTMDESRRPWFKRVPWWLWIAFVVILVFSVVFALSARGPAVEEVSMAWTLLSARA